MINWQIVFSVALGVMLGIKLSELLTTIHWAIQRKLHPERYPIITGGMPGYMPEGMEDQKNYINMRVDNCSTVSWNDGMNETIFTNVYQSKVRIECNRVIFKDSRQMLHGLYAGDVILYDTDNNVIDIMVSQ